MISPRGINAYISIGVRCGPSLVVGIWSIVRIGRWEGVVGIWGMRVWARLWESLLDIKVHPDRVAEITPAA